MSEMPKEIWAAYFGGGRLWGDVTPETHPDNTRYHRDDVVQALRDELAETKALWDFDAKLFLEDSNAGRLERGMLEEQLQHSENTVAALRADNKRLKTNYRELSNTMDNMRRRYNDHRKNSR